MQAPIKWHRYGTKDPAAPAALFLHGFMGRGEDWKEIAETVIPRHRCFCPDLPGHGSLMYDRVGAAAGIPKIADSLIEGLHTFGVSTCILIGYSMGGRIALQTILRHPKDISNLVLVSTSPGIRTDHERSNRCLQDKKLEDQLFCMKEKSNDFESFLRSWYQQSLFSEIAEQPQLFETVLQQRLKNHPPSLSAVLRNTGVTVHPGFWEQLTKITVPTSIIVGEKDKKYCSIAEKMLPLLSRGMLKVVAGCSHAPHIEYPKQFLNALNYLLRENCKK